MIEATNLIAVFIQALIMTGIGAYYDLRTNEVENWVWLVGGIGGVLLAVFHYGFSIFLLVHFVFAAIVGVAIVAAFYKFDKYIGGADAKAIVALGLILSYWSFIILGVSILILEVFLIFVGLFKRERIGLKELMEMKAPYLPFLFLGTASVFIGLVVS